ncbi:hypothetical protein HU200_007034 [Digitaria exilis]|uniref:Uncharacterized protein n=1 Tax=Digitaria exilis TaxID=1010633 RepID=A0A835FQC0_9POAL|nr:hypothetical protein HU200_007034 [Digitaria exilis]
MAEASECAFRVVACAQRVCMVALSIVLPMVVEKGVLALVALRVLEAHRVLCAPWRWQEMQNLRAAPRVPKGALISVRPWGGKRCSWGQQCDRFVRSKIGLCSAHSA